MRISNEEILKRATAFAESISHRIVEINFELQPVSELDGTRYSAITLTVHPEDIEDFTIDGAGMSGSKVLRNRYAAAAYKALMEKSNA